jgi:chemotaxis protein CheC
MPRPLQHDALLEAFNLALARAAVSLSRLMHETIALTAPQLELLAADGAIARIKALADERVAAVVQRFEGDLAAHALLLFPQSRALEVVRLAVGGLVGEEDLSELEEEAISEVGNILLNACMAVLANQLHMQLRTAPPAYVLDLPEHVLASHGGPGDRAVLMIHMIMTVESRDLATYICFLLDARANAALSAAVDRYLEGIGLAATGDRA